MKILVSAYACRPCAGSEPGVGWNIVQELAKYYQIWVLTRSDNKLEIEAEVAKQQNLNLQFIYCDPPSIAAKLPAAQVPHYYFWQISAYFAAQKLIEKVNIDLIHHITYVRYSTPSFLSLLPVPLIWGPVGGGEMVPRAFWYDFSIRGKVYEILRLAVHRLGELDPFTQITAQRSAFVKVTTEDTARRVRRIGGLNVEICSESALSNSEIQTLSQCVVPRNAPVRFISMARLLHWKGLHLSIQAFAKADLSPDTEYWILGEGPEQARLQNLIYQLKVENRIKLLGKLSRDETLQKLGVCHVLVHSSLHDSGGWVCLEAMAAGRPVVCLDLGGPALQVTSETGIKIKAHTPQQVVDDLTKAMILLERNADLRTQMGKAGQQRVLNYFSWELRIAEFSKQYLKLCNGKI